MAEPAAQAGPGQTLPQRAAVGERVGVWQSVASLLSRPRLKLALWIVLLVLTSAIFAVPVQLSWDYSAVQSLNAFHGIAGFTALFYAWLATWVLLVIPAAFGYGQARQETFALAVMFALVFAGFWLRLYRGAAEDAYSVMSSAEWIRAEGTVSSASPGYSTFPGTGILASVLGQVTGATTPDTIFFLALLQPLLFAGVFYVLLIQHLGQASTARSMALWAIPLAMYSSVPFFNLFAAFDARTNATLLLFPLWLLLVLKYALSGYQPRWGMLVITTLAALTVTHFPTSLVAAILLSIFALWGIGVGQRTVSWALVALGWVIVAAWEVVTPFGILHGLVTGGRETVEDFIKGAVLEQWFLPLQTSSYVRQAIPWWASTMFYVWLALVLGLTALTLLTKLGRGRHLGKMGKWELSGLAGVGLFGILLMFSGGAEEAINRTLMYAPFVCVPFAFAFVSSLRPVRRTAMVTALAALLVILSLPTFLAFNRSVAQFTTHAEETAGGEFLQHALSERDSVQLYGPQVERYIGYYLPQATDLRVYSGDLRTRSQTHLWQQMDEIVTEFLESGTNARVSLVAFSPRWREPFLRFFGEDPVEDRDWRELQSRLAQSSRFYDNGPIEYFGVWGNR